ncbi:MAG: isochorismate synthase [Paludibacter sp.]|nr:isochorismate synthase [Paludibacter sp.]
MIFESSTYLKISELQQVCLKKNIPFASYRLPQDVEITTLIQCNSMPEELTSMNNVENKSGFIVAPFFCNENHAGYILSPDTIFHTDTIDSEFIEKLALNENFALVEKPLNTKVETTQSAEFIQQVNAALNAIEMGEFHKVVLSKVRLEMLHDDFKAEEFFLKLCAAYPNAFVYIMQLPKVGCWIGATPEPLLVIENDKVRTVSLAGTQMADKKDIDAYKWSDKEIDEQDIVTDFVEKNLQSLKIKNITKVGPVNYQAANLIHLKSSFEFPLHELNNRLGDFINALHPTPSVGGLPKNAAREFILANEKHDRNYYTGFLGPLNIDKKSNVFVNLRCLQLFDNHFVLYSGAGITKSSNAQNEWEETDNKMMTMMNVMNIPNTKKK